MKHLRPFIIAGELGILCFGILSILARLENDALPPGTEGGYLTFLVFMFILAPMIVLDTPIMGIFGEDCLEGVCATVFEAAFLPLSILVAFLWGVLAYGLFYILRSRFFPAYVPPPFLRGRANLLLLTATIANLLVVGWFIAMA